MTKNHKIIFKETGGPDVLQWQEEELKEPGNDEVILCHKAIGVNYIDTYHRTGLYPVPLPNGIGLEGAGIIEAVGRDVKNFSTGDRVAYGTGPLGAYSERVTINPASLLKLPSSISFEQGAAMMLQGMTVQYLLERTYKVQKGDTILIHTAAGGVGLILCQWAKHLGATIIGTVGSEEKAALAKAHGCDHPILYREEDFVSITKGITEGKGVSVVYDSVGADTLIKSLDCLKPRGMLVSFGNSSGAPPEIDIGLLGSKGSLFLTRPSLFHYCLERDELEASAARLFSLVEENVISIEPSHTYDLKEAAQAHKDLEARKTTGSIILIP